MRNIILSDNQYITRVGVKHLLSITMDSQVVEADNKSVLIAQLLKEKSSIVIIDYTLFDFESINELYILETRFENADWIIFADELSEDFLRSLVFNTNSFSIVMKNSTKEEIENAIFGAQNRKRYICNEVSNLLLSNNQNRIEFAGKGLLTGTEKEILREIALGKTTKEIASNRFLSAHTVMTHRKNIFRKIEVNNVHEATKYAIRAGIVDMTEYYI